MSSRVIPVRALVWLHIDEDGDVEQAELSGDVSWMRPDPEMIGFIDEPYRALSDAETLAALAGLVEDERWANVELTFAI